jgi:hypothetical protein
MLLLSTLSYVSTDKQDNDEHDKTAVCSFSFGELFSCIVNPKPINWEHSELDLNRLETQNRYSDSELYQQSFYVYPMVYHQGLNLIERES